MNFVGNFALMLITLEYDEMSKFRLFMFYGYSGLADLYKLSYMWYSSLAVVTTVVVGIVVSCLTGTYTCTACVNLSLDLCLYDSA